MTDSAEQHDGVSRRAQIMLLLASVGGAVSNFGILFVSAKVLDVQENTEFLVFWSLMFGLFGVQSGLQNEATRATTNPSPRGARALVTGAIIGTVSLAVLAATAVLWAPRMLPLSPLPGAATVCLLGMLYPLYVTMVGALGGSRRWETYGLTLLTEVGVRVALVLAIAALGLGLAGFEIASAGGILALVLLPALSPAARRALARRADVPVGRALRNAGWAMTSTTCTALLVTGYSALVAAVAPNASLGDRGPAAAAALMGACMLAVSLTRAPLMMPLTAFVGVAISAFTKHTGTVREAVGRPFLMLGALGLVGACAAWPIGPWALRLFKPEYDLPGWYLAALTASSTLMAWLTILGALALATNRHRLYLGGWCLASAVAIGCLVLPLPLLVTTTLSLSLGPALGCLLFWTALTRPRAHALDTDPAPEVLP